MVGLGVSLFGLCTSVVFKLVTAIFLPRNHLEMQTHRSTYIVLSLCPHPLQFHIHPFPKFPCIFHINTYPSQQNHDYSTTHDSRLYLLLNNIILATTTTGTVFILSPGILFQFNKQFSAKRC